MPQHGGKVTASPCQRYRSSVPNRHGSAEKHKPRTYLLEFCHYYAPGWINTLQPNNFCSPPACQIPMPPLQVSSAHKLTQTMQQQLPK